MTLPNLFIIGAAKSGTTSLLVNMAAHPEIYLAPREIHFFDLDRNWARGVSWYESHFDDARGQALIGEKTPGYLADARAPERIASTVADPGTCHFVAILREPVSRAVSEVAHRRRQGVESRSTEDALLAATSDEHVDPRFDYIRRGFYAPQLARYFTLFGRERVKVAFYDDLMRDPGSVFEQLFASLGVRPFEPTEADVAFNRAGRVARPWLFRGLRIVRADAWLPAAVGAWVWDRMWAPVEHPSLSEDLLCHLRAVTAVENRRLEELLGTALPGSWAVEDR